MSSPYRSYNTRFSPQSASRYSASRYSAGRTSPSRYDAPPSRYRVSPGRYDAGRASPKRYDAGRASPKRYDAGRYPSLTNSTLGGGNRMYEAIDGGNYAKYDHSYKKYDQRAYYDRDYPVNKPEEEGITLEQYEAIKRAERMAKLETDKYDRDYGKCSMR